MKTATPILSISASDSTGQSGIQSDIQTIAALGGYSLTAIACLSIKAGNEARTIRSLPADLVVEQTAAIIRHAHPKAIKVGLIADGNTIRRLRQEVIASPRLVIAPGIFDSDGTQMISDDAIRNIALHLVPEALLVMLRCKDAEKMLGMRILTNDDMEEAALRLQQTGAQWVLLRGGQTERGRITALLSSREGKQFFSSYNTEGWQQHGVSGALSAAITTRLAMGDNVATAIRNAHDFIHAQVVYAKEGDGRSLRAIDLYNSFVSLVSEHVTQAHDVAFYAGRLCITPRYLSQITDKVVGKTPKQIVADYLQSMARNYLKSSRLSMQEIADRLGFSGQVPFCKFFKHNEGVSPSEYRNRL